MDIQCSLDVRKSKNGKEYVVYVLDFGNGYKRIVFPESNAESFMLKSFLGIN